MACTSFGNNIIIILADAAVAAFEAVVPALQAAGALTTAEGTALQNYATLATTTIQTIITEIKSGTSTLSKIASVIQTLVQAYDTLGLSGPISLWVTVANATLQALLNALLAETGTATAAAVSVAPIHPGILEKHKLNTYHDRLQKVATSIASTVAAKESAKLVEG